MPKLMVVDDEVVIASQLEKRLTAMGYEVVGKAFSGEESVEKARRLRPDLILMDIAMPGELDGIGAADIIGRELDIPVIFLTAHATEEFVEKAKALEPLGYILKPFKEAEVKVTVEIGLYKKEMDRQLRESRAALQKANDELELQVAKRTVELEKAVKDLTQEIIERKQTEKNQALLQQRLEALWKISKMVDANEQTLYDEVLTQVKDLTQSSYAFFGFLDNDESVMSLYSWSKEAIEDCRIVEKPIEFPISKAGLWGEAVRKRRWFIINDYREKHPAKKGFPDGHVSMTRLLAVPIFSRDRIVSLAVVANKETEYVEEDAEQIEAFIANAQILLKWKRTEEARKAAEEELEKQRVLSMHRDRLIALGEMAAGIAHELNQPLSGVRGLAEHLLIAGDRGWNLKPEDYKDRLKVIIEQSDRMSHIIDHVRMFAREAGKPEVRPVNVSDVVNSSLQILGQQFKSHGLKINTELENCLPVVQVNPFSLEEVILNLLANARDAVEERLKTNSTASSLILVRAFTDPQDKKQPLKIQVIDQGIGISQDNLLKVFDLFFTTKTPDKGTGLGLSICKSIVEEFGGGLKIQSELGQGTTITISLPVEGYKRPLQREQNNCY